MDLLLNWSNYYFTIEDGIDVVSNTAIEEYHMVKNKNKLRNFFLI